MLLALLALVACTENLCDTVEALPEGGDVLAIGDSLLAWKAPRCQSVPDHLAMTRGRKVTNRAINGTRVLDGGDAIPAQYSPDGWAWVIVDGGGNDLNSSCDCENCDFLLDQIVSEDGSTGDMPDLVDRVVGDGAQVMLLGYYLLPENARYGFAECRDSEFPELFVRYEALASARDGVTFVNLGEVMDPTSTPEAYDNDHLHPSPEGAALLGALLAEKLAEATP